MVDSIIAIFTNPWRYRELIWQLSKREVLARYKGSMIGLLWSFFNPVFMLAVYTFFFSIVYNARWGNSNASKFDFAITLFAGLIPFTLFSECVNRAPYMIINNVNYVKKVIFPLQILPWVNLASALFHAVISVFVLLLFYAVINHSLNWTALLLPIVNLPLVFWILGLTWLLASLGIFIRDVTHSVTIFTTALMFLSPVFYSVSAIPMPYRSFIYLNPLTTIIEQNREILIAGHLPNWQSLGISFLVSIAVAWLGYAWFEKTRPAFADVI
jgi:lipopolysaccharide transport system permease protein